MVRKIQLESLYEVEKSKLGTFPTEADFDEIIDEDCDIYRPDGSIALVFRKKALKTLLKMTPETEEYKYWRWVSRDLLSDQRGDAAGKDINTNLEIRLTEGQKKFFAAAIKGKVTTLEEAQDILQDTTPSRSTFYAGKVEADGLVDLEEYTKWNKIAIKKATPLDLREEAILKRNAARLAWFDVWLVNVWDKAEDRVFAAKEGKKRYVTAQPRANKTYSNVLGTIDRSGRMPFGRLTATTMRKWDKFESQKDFFHEVNTCLKETMPQTWELLNDRFQHVKDPRYNLFGTCFTSITINYNFQVAYHYDGNNAKDAVAVLSVLEDGTYEGSEFVFPQLRLAFNLRAGDFLAGDNQGLMHAMMPFKNTSKDFDSVWFVFYQRDSIIKLDSLECETCRRQFMEYAVQNYAAELGSGEKNWTGSFSGMWGSQQWKDYKEMRAKEGEYDYTKCLDTNLKGDPDTLKVGRGMKCQLNFAN